MKGMEIVLVQPFGALGQRCVVRLPVADRILDIHPRGREDSVRQLHHRNVVGLARKNLLCPGKVGIGNDVPVDVEAGDLLQRRLIGHRVRLVGARHFGRVLRRQQRGVLAAHGKPRGIVGEGLRHAFVEPAGGTVEASVGAVTEARQRDLVIVEDRRHQTGAGLVGMLDDAPG